jgi:hypothetical protein
MVTLDTAMTDLTSGIAVFKAGGQVDLAALITPWSRPASMSTPPSPGSGATDGLPEIHRNHPKKEVTQPVGIILPVELAHGVTDTQPAETVPPADRRRPDEGRRHDRSRPPATASSGR